MSGGLGMAHDDRAWEKLLEISERTVRTAEATNGLLERIMTFQEEERALRAKALGDLKAHIDTSVSMTMARSEMWWRRAFMVSVALMMFATVFGVALDKFIGLLK